METLAPMLMPSLCSGGWRLSPQMAAEQKVKKVEEQLEITLVKNRTSWPSGQMKTAHQVLVGFAAETTTSCNATEKLHKKNLDFIVANDLLQKELGLPATPTR